VIPGLMRNPLDLFKSQTPSTKPQISTNDQNPNDPNKDVFGIWELEFVWSLDIGIWNFYASV
jgi:hypothetical protein